MRLLYRCLLVFAAVNACASDLDTIGITLVRSFDPTLLGTGVPVVQVEAEAPGWEVNPAAVAQPTSLFTWHSASGTSSTFPNSAGAESWHADQVGGIFYGTIQGAALGVLHVDNYEAVYFISDIVQPALSIPANLANQSFTLANQNLTVDQDYDDYAARYNVLFVTGAGNDGAVKSPGTAYNSIAIAAYGGSSSVGPTTDGRAKPDITAPGSLTSFSAALVSGAAAVLLQAGNRGDGGPNSVSAASDIRLLKALLLDGAQKPTGWTNSTSTPLDLRHGAGIVNAFQSWRQLRGGKHSAQASTQVTLGGAHPPPSPTGAYVDRRGWDLATATSTVPQDGIKHYFLNAQAAPNRLFTFTATLVWNRQRSQSTINDLNLFLYNDDNGALVASSQSLVDNVEHIYLTNLPPGTYDLQVFKSGGLLNRVSNDETYALAFDFGPPEPAHFVNTKVLSGNFQSTLSGEPNQNYAIQATSDFLTWTTVAKNQTSSAGITQFFTSASTSPRFFRALELP